MRKLIIECIGTFFLVLTISFTGNPIAIGGILAAMIYMGGYISGAHYNPAVTLAVFIRRAISLKESLGYLLAQIIGSLGASSLYLYILKEPFAPAPHPLATYQGAVIMEFLFTFALASTVLHVATSKETKGNQYYGAAIGLVVMAGAFAGGLSGGVYNPAVAIGAYLSNISQVSTNLQNLYIYLIGPLTGGAVAGALYRLVNAETAKKHHKSA